MRLVWLPAVVAFVLPTIGCGPPEIVRSTRFDVHAQHVTVNGSEAVDAAESKVTRGEPYRVSVSLSPKSAEDATEQDGEWVFYKDGYLFGRLEADDVDFSDPPTVLALDAHSAAKKTGKYTYELYLDDELVAEVPVEIVPPPRPRVR